MLRVKSHPWVGGGQRLAGAAGSVWMEESRRRDWGPGASRAIDRERRARRRERQSGERPAAPNASQIPRRVEQIDTNRTHTVTRRFELLFPATTVPRKSR